MLLSSLASSWLFLVCVFLKAGSLIDLIATRQKRNLLRMFKCNKSPACPYIKPDKKQSSDCKVELKKDTPVSVSMWSTPAQIVEPEWRDREIFPNNWATSEINISITLQPSSLINLRWQCERLGKPRWSKQLKTEWKYLSIYIWKYIKYECMLRNLKRWYIFF